MKELQSDTLIVILPAEKGRSTVILNREECLESFMDHINNGQSYHIIKTKTLKQLKDLKNNKIIYNKLHFCLKPTYSLVPNFYDQPRMYKPGVPIRPIVSYSSLPLYNLNKYISYMLKMKITTPRILKISLTRSEMLPLKMKR